MASISNINSDDKRLLARAEDAVRICSKRQTAHFVGFLDERQAALVKAHPILGHGEVCFRFFGGHADAERVMLGVSSQEYFLEDAAFPLTAVGFSFRRGIPLTHRDVLGSLLGCGIAREKVGDILCTDGLAVAFIADELVPFVADSMTKIGRKGVKVQIPFEGTLPVMHTFKPVSGTLASARLDAVLKVLLGISREQAGRLIQSALVSINHQQVTSVSVSVKPGDVISVRGSGRFVIDDASDTTKKGRVILRARKYV